MTSAQRDYCGCCGGNLPTQTEVWCFPCQHHVRKNPGWPLWECTYFAQHKRICPFDVNLDPAVRERNMIEAPIHRPGGKAHGVKTVRTRRSSGPEDRK